MANTVTVSGTANEKGQGGYTPSLYSSVITGYAAASWDTDIATASGLPFTVTVSGATVGSHVELELVGDDGTASQFRYWAAVPAASQVAIHVQALVSGTPPTGLTGFNFAVLKFNFGQ